jgi:hypothetical protein
LVNSELRRVRLSIHFCFIFSFLSQQLFFIDLEEQLLAQEAKMKQK